KLAGDAKAEAGEGAAAEAKRGPRLRARRSSADAVRDITAKAGVEATPAERPAPTTPAELKNPFGNP
ncbi:MAG TPA: hypothetical protein VHL80_12430, partial [Polyangia bacterium]|nr:hypothetical protein [Polyangia bacterium]